MRVPGPLAVDDCCCARLLPAHVLLPLLLHFVLPDMLVLLCACCAGVAVAPFCRGAAADWAAATAVPVGVIPQRPLTLTLTLLLPRTRVCDVQAVAARLASL